MLHDNMTLSRFIVSAQSIEESLLERKGIGVKRERIDGKNYPRFKKRGLNNYAPKVNHKKGGCSQIFKPTFSTCGKNRFSKCLSGTSGSYGCGKNDQMVRDGPAMSARMKEAKKALS